MLSVQAECVGVSGIRVTEGPAPPVDHTVEERHEGVGALELLDQRAMDRPQQIAGRAGLPRIDPGRAHGECHDQGGAEPVRGDVTEHGAEHIVGEPKELIEVASDRARRDAAGAGVGDVVVLREVGEKLGLEIARQLHLADHALARQDLLE